MRILRPQQGNLWVLAKEHLTVESLPRRLRAADVCLSDLDDTDCNSPAKLLTSHAIGTHYWSPRWLDWAVRNFVVQRNGNGVESARWDAYVQRFLSTAERRQEAKRFFTKEQVRATLFPGVAAFYQHLPAVKVYVTRNIEEVVESYARELGFTEWHGEEQCKRVPVERYLKEHPEQQHYLVKGDSEEDFEMLEVLRSYQKRKKIESVLGIYCAQRFFKEKHNFDVEIGRDYRGLVELLNAH